MTGPRQSWYMNIVQSETKYNVVQFEEMIFTFWGSALMRGMKYGRLKE